MPANSKCRFAINLGLGAISFVKVARDSEGWQVVSSGELPWHSLERAPDQNKEELETLLRKLALKEGVSREPIHISLHSRYCVSRVVTGNRKQVEEQLEEIVTNSHHYLQFGLGEKLIGQSTTLINESQQYGQVAIIKRGLIESVEKAIQFSSLELESVDGAMPCVSRLIGYAELDANEPLLLVWMTGDSAEIGISHQGRLQLTYHLGGGSAVDDVADTISKHMKRLQRFCNRYRSVDGDGQLRQVLVLASPENSARLKQRLEGVFGHVYTGDDLALGKLNKHLSSPNQLSAPGIVSALGGLLVHLENDTLPTTDIFQNYLASKPRTWFEIVFREGWMVIAAAVILLTVSGYSWWIGHRINVVQRRADLVAVDFAAEREQLIELDDARTLLREYQRLESYATQVSEMELVHLVAKCLPEDTRVDSFAVDSQDRMILKGSMLEGDKTYEVLKALRDSPVVAEVALESVGKAVNFGNSATMFEIHCQVLRQPAEPDDHVATAPLTRRVGE